MEKKKKDLILKATPPGSCVGESTLSRRDLCAYDHRPPTEIYQSLAEGVVVDSML